MNGTTTAAAVHRPQYFDVNRRNNIDNVVLTETPSVRSCSRSTAPPQTCLRPSSHRTTAVRVSTTVPAVRRAGPSTRRRPSRVRRPASPPSRSTLGRIGPALLRLPVAAPSFPVDSRSRPSAIYKDRTNMAEADSRTEMKCRSESPARTAESATAVNGDWPTVGACPVTSL